MLCPKKFLDLNVNREKYFILKVLIVGNCKQKRRLIHQPLSGEGWGMGTFVYPCLIWLTLIAKSELVYYFEQDLNLFRKSRSL